MSVVYYRRHIAHDKKIRCPLCGKNIRLYEKINVSHTHTLTHQVCSSIVPEQMDSGTYREIISKYPKWFPLDH